MDALWDLLQRHMVSEGIRPAELARRCALAESGLTRMREGKIRTVDPDTLRKLAEGTGLRLVDLIVASGMWTADELNVPVVYRDPAELSNDELIRILRQRMRPEGVKEAHPRNGTRGPAPASTEHGVDRTRATETSRESPRLVPAPDAETGTRADSSP